MKQQTKVSGCLSQFKPRFIHPGLHCDDVKVVRLGLRQTLTLTGSNS